jgi:hypothetical protein
LANNWKARTVGILSIVMGSIAFTATCLFGLFIWSVSSGIATDSRGGDISWLVILTITMLLAVPSLVGIVGGIFSLKQKRWGWVLAGTICIVMYFNILGVPALTLTILSKNEFQQDKYTLLWQQI